jgi:GNAT superfamily N-acetyltransferase
MTSTVRSPSAGPVVIRDACPADAPGCAALTASHWGDDDTVAVGGDAEQRWLNRYTENIRAPDRYVVMAELDGQVIGCGQAVYFTPPPDAHTGTAPAGWYLVGLIVRPDHRSRGVGRMLTAARLDWIRERADEAYYFTNVRNRVSREAHRAAGFIP